MEEFEDLETLWEGDNSETQLEAYQRLTQQNTRTIEKHTRPSSPPPPRQQQQQQHEQPIVISLDAHYRKVYNREMNSRFPEDSSENSSVDNEEQEEQEEDTLHSGEERPLKRRKTSNHRHEREECYLCAWGNKFHDGIEAPHVNKLVEILQTNYGIHSNIEIAQELHLYFKNHVFDPTTGMKMLTKEIALEHIEELHSLDARIFIGESIKSEKKLLFCFQNAIWRDDNTYDKDTLAQYRKSKKELRDLYMMPISKMNFNNGNNADDMKKAANYFNLMPKFNQRKTNKCIERRNINL
jgi:hypothetical protein